MLLIADISRGEDDPETPATVDFNKMKAAGVFAVYFRATNGVMLDKTFAIFERNAGGVLPWGVFGVPRPTTEGYSIKTQALAFIEAVGSDNDYGQLPIVVDWEVEGVTWKMADEYIAIIETAFPEAEIILYSRAEFLKRMLPNRFLSPTKYARFARLAVWQAHYGVSIPDPLPVGFIRIFWQFTDRADASLYGITEAKQLDMSYFDVTLEQAVARLKLAPIMPPPVIPPTTGNSFSANVSGLTFDAKGNVTGEWWPTI